MLRIFLTVFTILAVFDNLKFLCVTISTILITFDNFDNFMTNQIFYKLDNFWTIWTIFYYLYNCKYNPGDLLLGQHLQFLQCFLPQPNFPLFLCIFFLPHLNIFFCFIQMFHCLDFSTLKLHFNSLFLFLFGIQAFGGVSEVCCWSKRSLLGLSDSQPGANSALL